MVLSAETRLLALKDGPVSRQIAAVSRNIVWGEQGYPDNEMLNRRRGVALVRRAHGEDNEIVYS